MLPTSDDRTNPKDILGATKPMLGLNPRVALLWMAKAFEFGAYGRDANGVQVREKGYGEYNWRDRHVSEMVYVHAMERHIADFLDGQDLASDSKCKHLGHIMACAAILLDAEECGALKRDRPKPGKAADLIERMTIKKKSDNSDKTEFHKAMETLVDLDADQVEAVYKKAYDKFLNESLTKLERQLYYEPLGTLYRNLPHVRAAKRRGKGGRKVKANHHGRGRKARK